MKQLDVKDKLILAPMAGITDLPFRLLCKEQGCDIQYTEMISAKGMMYGNKNSIPLLMTVPEEGTVGVQLFGSEPDILAEQAKRIEDKGFSFIDINAGCPVPKIVNNGEGSALMKTPEQIGKIVAAIDHACKLPVTVKMRAGFREDEKNAPEAARIAEECGAAAVAVHGRTRSQYYEGKADWDIIRKVKEAVSIPVIGNGDLASGADVIRMRTETGCDGFMIGRAAKGNPWIFREIKAELAGMEVPPRPTLKEIQAMILRHAGMMIEMKGGYIGIREMRKHAAWYTAGLKNSAKFRLKVNEVESYEELETIVMQLTEDN